MSGQVPVDNRKGRATTLPALPSAPAVNLKKKSTLDQKRDVRPFHMKDFKQLKFAHNIEKRYILGDVIGQGAFGTVRLARQVDTGK